MLQTNNAADRLINYVYIDPSLRENEKKNNSKSLSGAFLLHQNKWFCFSIFFFFSNPTRNRTAKRLRGLEVALALAIEIKHNLHCIKCNSIWFVSLGEDKLVFIFIFHSFETFFSPPRSLPMKSISRLQLQIIPDNLSTFFHSSDLTLTLLACSLTHTWCVMLMLAHDDYLSEFIKQIWAHPRFRHRKKRENYGNERTHENGMCWCLSFFIRMCIIPVFLVENFHNFSVHLNFILHIKKRTREFCCFWPFFPAHWICKTFLVNSLARPTPPTMMIVWLSWDVCEARPVWSNWNNTQIFSRMLNAPPPTLFCSTQLIFHHSNIFQRSTKKTPKTPKKNRMNEYLKKNNFKSLKCTRTFTLLLHYRWFRGASAAAKHSFEASSKAATSRRRTRRCRSWARSKDRQRSNGGGRVARLPQGIPESICQRISRARQINSR